MAEIRITIEDGRAELRELRDRLTRMPDPRGSHTIRIRDQLVRGLLQAGVRPIEVQKDSGLSKSRVLQIRKEVHDDDAEAE